MNVSFSIIGERATLITRFPESPFHFLHDKCEDVDAKDSENLRIPLHYFAKLDERVQRDNGIPSYIRHLVSHETDIYDRDVYDGTTVDMAVEVAHQEP
jgi:hypothetical protein